jgi:hypothetical protein
MPDISTGVEGKTSRKAAVKLLSIPCLYRPQERVLLLAVTRAGATCIRALVLAWQLRIVGRIPILEQHDQAAPLPDEVDGAAEVPDGNDGRDDLEERECQHEARQEEDEKRDPDHHEGGAERLRRVSAAKPRTLAEEAVEFHSSHADAHNHEGHQKGHERDVHEPVHLRVSLEELLVFGTLENLPPDGGSAHAAGVHVGSRQTRAVENRFSLGW